MFFLLAPLRRTPPLCPAERTQTGTFQFSACPGKVMWCLERASFQIPHFSTVLPARALLFYYVGESPGHDTRARAAAARFWTHRAESRWWREHSFLFSLHHLDSSGHISCVFTLTAAIVPKIAQMSVTAPECDGLPAKLFQTSLTSETLVHRGCSFGDSEAVRGDDRQRFPRSSRLPPMT